VTKPMTMNEYLDAVIDSGVNEPAKIAKEVLAMAPNEVIQTEILTLLRHAARNRLVQRRVSNPIITGTSSLSVFRGEVHSGRSVKVERIRAAEKQRLAKLLSDDIWTGSEHRQLAKATSVDLVGAAAHLRTSAAYYVGRAERYELLADVLEMYEVNQIDQLPPEVLLRLAGMRLDD
jgi:hypothetical protein